MTTMRTKNDYRKLCGEDYGYGTATIYTMTLEQQQELYDQEYEELMALPKEELVKRLIGERPPLNVRIG